MVPYRLTESVVSIHLQGGGYFGYVFTGNLDLAKKIGLKAKRRIEFYTSTIDCRLLEYELYAASRAAAREKKEA